jgi:hypothetical protein
MTARFGGNDGICFEVYENEKVDLYKFIRLARIKPKFFQLLCAVAEHQHQKPQPLYAKQEPRRFDRGTDLHTQSNPLPMCHRPGILVKVVAT